MEWLGLVDPGSLLIVASAIFVIYHGSYRSYSLSVNSPIVLQDNQQIPSILYVVLPVIGSIALLSLFYFLNIMYYFLLVIISISAVTSTTYVFSPLTKYIFSKAQWNDRSFKYKLDDEDLTFSYSMGLATIIGIIIVICWYFNNHFIFVNMLSMSIGIATLSILRVNNLKALLGLLWVFLAYDVFWVFISSKMFGESVMENVATGVMSKQVNLPMMIIYPRVFFDGGVSGLGNGDFVLPGIFMCQLYFIDKYYGYSANQKSFVNGGWWNISSMGYFRISIISYLFGLIMAMVMVMVMERGQPALLYLVPFVTLSTLIVGYNRNQLPILLKSIPKQKEDDIKQQQLEKLLPTQDDNNISNQDDIIV